MKEPIKQPSVELEEEENNALISSVGEGVEKKNQNENKPREVNPSGKQDNLPSTVIVPFPARLEERKKKDNEEFLSFLNVFKALNVNLPLLELLEKMSKYAKFLRDIMSRYKQIGKGVKITVNLECSVVIARKIPLKLKYLGSFTISIKIRIVNFGKALCDHGPNIKQMFLPTYHRLGLRELRDTTVNFQLADKSLVHPKDVLEDVVTVR